MSDWETDRRPLWRRALDSRCKQGPKRRMSRAEPMTVEEAYKVSTTVYEARGRAQRVR